MPTPILATKLYSPQPRAKVVLRPRLIERLNEGAHHKLTIISAPAGFGKSTLVSEWLATLTPSSLPVGEGPGVRSAWLSLDDGDNDPKRFLAYLIAALRTIAKNIGEGTLNLMDSSQSLAFESFLTSLLNEIIAIRREFILVLDDYHLIESQQVDEAVAFLIEHLPPQGFLTRSGEPGLGG